ncbi:MAG: hypothetical protein V5A24_04430 [Haloarculaceae archaeon]
MDVVPVPYPNGTDDSRLVEADVIWVRWNDRTYRVAPGEAATTTRFTARNSLSSVADTADGFPAHVVEQSLIGLSAVTDAEQSILRQAAADDGSEEYGPASEEYGPASEEYGTASEELTCLRERLPRDRHLPQPHARDWFLAFGGTRYRLSIVTSARPE